MLNKQQPFGGDVITRISATMLDPDALGRLQQAAARRRWPSSPRRSAARAGVDPAHVYEVGAGRQRDDDRAGARHRPRAARRRAVRHVHRRRPPTVLAARPRPRRCTRGRARVLFPALGAYVGGDIVAGMLATGHGPRQADPAVHRRRHQLRDRAQRRRHGSCRPRRPPGRRSRAARSAAACAPPTARSRWSSSTPTDGAGVELGVIGDVEPQGPVRLGARRRGGRAGAGRAARRDRPVRPRRARRGVAPGAGRPADHDRRGAGLRAAPADAPTTDPAECVVLSQRDVRELQFAKAAISTGWTLLLEELGLEHRDVQQVLLAGSFGSYLSAASAVRIGLVPEAARCCASSRPATSPARARRWRCCRCASAPAPRRCWRR